jgi:hypothetical protein
VDGTGRWRGASTPLAGFAPEALDIAVERFDWQKWLERDSSGISVDLL